MEVKVPKYLSPSAIATWVSNKEEFFLKYLAIDRPPKILQTQAMSVGSSFDAYIKSNLYTRIYGPEGAVKDGFNFETLFEKQVEPHNHDFAMKAGAVCYQAYKSSGAYAHLWGMLDAAVAAAAGASKKLPRFEFTAQSMGVDENGNVYNVVKLTPKVQAALDAVSTRPYGDVVLLGKPDLEFVTSTEVTVIDDWKVNGYMSQSGHNPVPGYVRRLDGFEPKTKHHGTSHKDMIPYDEGNLQYSLYSNIEAQKPDWAQQLAIYSWLGGAPVGSDIVIAIDQLCCTPSYPSPNITVALHRCMLTEAFQTKTYLLAQEIWDIIHSDHIFRELPLIDSIQRCEILLKQASVYKGDDDKTEFLRRMRRSG